MRVPHKHTALYSPGGVGLVFGGREPAAQTSEEVRFRGRAVPPPVHETVVQQEPGFFPQQLKVTPSTLFSAKNNRPPLGFQGALSGNPLTRCRFREGWGVHA